jgi:hypothetical protein
MYSWIAFLSALGMSMIARLNGVDEIGVVEEEMKAYDRCESPALIVGSLHDEK